MKKSRMKSSSEEKDDLEALTLALQNELMENSENNNNSGAVAKVFESSRTLVDGRRRRTKKQLKVERAQSQSRTLVDIISDPHSGQPLKSDIEKKSRKRDKKAGSKLTEKTDQALIKSEDKLNLVKSSRDGEPLIKGDADESSPQKAKFQQRVKIVNNKVVAEQQEVLSMNNAVQLVKEGMGPSVLADKSKRISIFDHISRDPTTRWSQKDTAKFYKALQLKGPDFAAIEGLFGGTRTRKQILNKFKKEEKSSKRRIDELIYSRITEEEYVSEFGDIPSQLKIQDSTKELAEKENDYEESSSEPDEPSLKSTPGKGPCQFDPIADVFNQVEADMALTRRDVQSKVAPSIARDKVNEAPAQGAFFKLLNKR